MQPNRKAKTSPRRQRGEATPSPSWVLFEADEAITTFRKAQYSNAQSYLHRKGTPHAEVCKLSHARLFFVSFLLATKEMKRRNIQNLCNPKAPSRVWGQKRAINPPLHPSQEGKTCCYQDLNPSNGKQPNRKALTSFRKHRGFATPSPSWVLFEADEATTTFSKARSSNAQANLITGRASTAEVCELSHDRLFFVSFLLATKEMKGKK